MEHDKKDKNESSNVEKGFLRLPYNCDKIKGEVHSGLLNSVVTELQSIAKSNLLVMERLDSLVEENCNIKNGICRLEFYGKVNQHIPNELRESAHVTSEHADLIQIESLDSGCQIGVNAPVSSGSMDGDVRPIGNELQPNLDYSKALKTGLNSRKGGKTRNNSSSVRKTICGSNDSCDLKGVKKEWFHFGRLEGPGLWTTEEQDNTEKMSIVKETGNHEDDENVGQNCLEDQEKFHEDDDTNLLNDEGTVMLYDTSDSVEETSKSDRKDYLVKLLSKNSRNQRSVSKTIVSKSKEVLQCNVCYITFKFPSHLNRHFQTHFDEKSFFCEICKKSFSRLHHLKEHLRMHTNERPFVCEFCNRSFTRSTTLKRHYNTHINESRFKCKTCNKSCVALYDLQIHLRTHTNEKPYRCGFCEKTFCHSSNLNQHLRIHTNEKPFVCEICNKSFNRSNVLKSHLIRHSNSRNVSTKL